MRTQKSLRLAINMLLYSKLRSWLTIIGIVIGIAAVVAIVSISEGAQQSLEENLGGLGAEIITITPGYSKATGSGFGPGSGDSSDTTTEGEDLTSKDIMVLKSIPNIKYVAGELSGEEDLIFSGETASITINGVDESVWDKMTTEEIEQGRFLVEGDSKGVVISWTIADSLFDEKIQLNRMINIGGQTFKVVGILKESSGMSVGGSSTVYMPIDSARNILEDVGDKEFDSISVSLEDIDLSDETVDEIERKLERSRGVLTEDDKDFTVSSMKSLQETISSTLNLITFMLSAIAAISLLVGGVGIANTMFTSVLEKTKDIGIMKAIGAQNKDILLIFLFNSGLIGLVGGIGGVLLGSLASVVIGSMGDPTATGPQAIFSSTALTPSLIIFALFFSVVIGMIAGAIPAYNASKLKPVDALRYE